MEVKLVWKIFLYTKVDWMSCFGKCVCRVNENDEYTINVLLDRNGNYHSIERLEETWTF